MVVAIVTWELHLNGCQSLKDKRRILKSLKDRLHQRFNVSVAETDHHELWQRAELTCGVVARDRKQASAVLSAADGLVASNGFIRIIDSATSFL
ncbi:MAG: DUF503 family protein [Gemmatimonadales bacterium]|nr:DUF503 family protein [Gemmatimonadales bacterium]NIN50186.1 DUF503 family protein [Gemmatimonadales bacterium]NIP07650.1 DUF503 family protein [Gemmatimonadales bacterium]NIR01802.1 DUF503 family protein [Gemmatimonadales bacterium]NIS65705.1 DUF503 family protein [Gemmatimonadales bacterium]